MVLSLLATLKLMSMPLFTCMNGDSYSNCHNTLNINQENSDETRTENAKGETFRTPTF